MSHFSTNNNDDGDHFSLSCVRNNEINSCVNPFIPSGTESPTGKSFKSYHSAAEFTILIGQKVQDKSRV